MRDKAMIRCLAEFGMGKKRGGKQDEQIKVVASAGRRFV